MIGFSLAHGAGAILFLFPFALTIWLLICFVTVAVWKFKKNRVHAKTWFLLGAGIAVLGVLTIPSSFWDRVFVGRLAGSSHAGQFLIQAASYGRQGTVKALLQRGVPLNATTESGDTALHAAAASGQIEMVNYLVERGADINAINLYGDSPLHRAIANHQQKVVQALTAMGAKNVEGDEVQRQRATEEIVRRDIERMNSH